MVLTAVSRWQVNFSLDFSFLSIILELWFCWFGMLAHNYALGAQIIITLASYNPPLLIPLLCPFKMIPMSLFSIISPCVLVYSALEKAFFKKLCFCVVLVIPVIRDHIMFVIGNPYPLEWHF